MLHSLSPSFRLPVKSFQLLCSYYSPSVVVVMQHWIFELEFVLYVSSRMASARFNENQVEGERKRRLSVSQGSQGFVFRLWIDLLCESLPFCVCVLLTFSSDSRCSHRYSLTQGSRVCMCVFELCSQFRTFHRCSMKIRRNDACSR